MSIRNSFSSRIKQSSDVGAALWCVVSQKRPALTGSPWCLKHARQGHWQRWALVAKNTEEPQNSRRAAVHAMQVLNKQNTHLGGGEVVRVQTKWNGLAQNRVNIALLCSFSDGSIQHPGGFSWDVTEINRATCKKCASEIQTPEFIIATIQLTTVQYS